MLHYFWLFTLKPTLHHSLQKWPTFPSGINKVHLISSCEISHLTSIAVQCHIAGGISADVITSQSLPQRQCAWCLSTSLIKNMRLCVVWPLHLPGGGTPAWFVVGVGQPRLPEADKAINRRGGRQQRRQQWWYEGRVRGKRDSPLRISGLEESRQRVNGKRSRHCNLSLRTHTQTHNYVHQWSLSVLGQASLSGCYSLHTHPRGLMSN